VYSPQIILIRLVDIQASEFLFTSTICRERLGGHLQEEGTSGYLRG
jgi:hypothetical protein